MKDRTSISSARSRFQPFPVKMDDTNGREVVTMIEKEAYRFILFPEEKKKAL